MNRLSSCCGVFSVRTGAYIVAILSILYSVVSMTYSGVEIAAGAERDFSKKFIKPVFDRELQDGAINQEEHKRLLSTFEGIDREIGVSAEVDLILASILLFLNLLLLVGVAKRRPTLILPWLVINAICIALSGFVCVMLAGYFLAYFPPSYGCIMLFIALPLCMLYGYLWLVVVAEYKNIKDRRRDYDRMSNEGIHLAQQTQRLCTSPPEYPTLQL